MDTSVVLRDETCDVLREWPKLPSRVWVDRRYQVTRTTEGFQLAEVPVSPAFYKDYDAVSSPEDWSTRWDLSPWGVISALHSSERVGWAVLAHDTPRVEMLEGRKDLAVLWDLRVLETCRRRGIATRLLRGAQQWARHRACTRLKVETQNTNVPACRLYAGAGFRLLSAAAGVYAEDPEEIQLIWELDLGGPER
jgi:ribosomal protein S18 acetylase RimI-like enzyme